MRLLTVISGVLMAISGVFCFMNPGQTFLAMAFIIGIVMILNGAIHALAYLVGRGIDNKKDNNGWIIVDALITLLLGILVLTNQLVADSSIHMVFGMWLLVSGTLRIEAASRIDYKTKKEKKNNFVITMVTGVITTVVGLFGFVNPLVSLMNVSTIVLLGVFMLVQGVNVIELGIDMPHEKRVIKQTIIKAIKITEAEETEEAVKARLKMKAKEDAQRSK